MHPTNVGSSVKTYLKTSSRLLTTFFVLLPIFIVPFLNVSFSFAKIGFIALFAVIVAVLAILEAINEKQVFRPGLVVTVAALAVPVAYFLSSLFSPARAISFIGQGVDLDTFFFVFIGFLLVFLVAYVYKRDGQATFSLVMSFLAVSCAIGIFHLLRYAFGTGFLSLGLFTAVTANTVGSFSDLGIYFSVAAILSMVTLEFLPLNGTFKILGHVSLVVSFLMVLAANFNIFSSVFGLGFPISLTSLIAIFAIIIFAQKKVSGMRAFPWVSCAVFIVALVCIVEAVPIAQAFVSHTGVTQAEVLDLRVSPAGTAITSARVLGAGTRPLLLGTGPNRFSVAWGAFKPTQLPNSSNLSPYWDVDFNLGFGYVLTALATSGLIGGIAWAFFFVVMLWGVIKLLSAVFSSHRKSEDPLIAFSSIAVSIATLYLWLIAIIYTPGPAILAFTFFFTGLLGALLIQNNVISLRKMSWAESGYWKSFGVVLLLVILLSGIAVMSYEWATRLVASLYAEQAVQLLQDQPTQIDQAEALTYKAITIYPSDTYLRFYTDVALIRPMELVSSTNGIVSQQAVTEQIATDANQAVSAAQEAALNQNPTNYQNWIELGKAYETLTFLGATSSATLAAQSYSEAEALSPTSPLPPYLLGRLYLYGGNIQAGLAELQKAIVLKPDYADAERLYEQAAATTRQTMPVPETSSSAVASSSSAMPQTTNGQATTKATRASK